MSKLGLTWWTGQMTRMVCTCRVLNTIQIGNFHHRLVTRVETEHRHSSTNAKTTPLLLTQVREAVSKYASRYKEEKKKTDRSKIKYPGSQTELPIRKMKDSYQEVIIPLTDVRVRQKYLNVFNTIRFGRLLEDLDTFAGIVCFKHLTGPSMTPDPRTPVAMATALVDKITLDPEPILCDKDIKMSGNLTWTGTSSMEATLKMEQEKANSWVKLLEARFVFVSRNVLTGGPAFVSPLKPEGEQEETIFQMGEARKKKRIVEASETLLKTPPNEEERQLIHDLFLQTLDSKSYTFRVRVKPENSEWMENARLKNLIICFPEQKNVNNKIFGGFLMRKAFELAWVNAILYCKTRPSVEIVDDIVFRKPVEIGSLLFLSSQVVYTEGSRLQVKVHAEVVSPKDGTHETTNDFHFTFNSGVADVQRVIPKTYAESMLYLEGKRHFES